jgi:membrane-associated protein
MGSTPRHRQGGRVITEWLGSFFAMIDAIPMWQLYTVVGVLLVLETTVLVGLVTPGEVVLLAAATTVGSAGEYAALAAIAAGASFAGQTGGYLIGRRFGGRIRGSWGVIAGTLRMPWGRYARYTVLGAVLWGLVYVGLGSAASIAIRKSAHLLGPTVTTVLVAAVVVALIVRTVRKRRRAAGAPVDGGAPTVAIAVGDGDPLGSGSPEAPVRR